MVISTHSSKCRDAQLTMLENGDIALSKIKKGPLYRGMEMPDW